MKKITLIILFTMIFVAACGGSDNDTPPPTETAVSPPAVVEATNTPVPAAPDQRAELTAHPWAWVRFLDQSSGPSDVTYPQNYVVTFMPDGALQVRADCNNASGTFLTNTTNLSINLGPMTLAACPEGSRSDQFLNLLGGAAAYEIGGGQLRIDLVADSGSLFFVPEDQVAVAPTAVPSSPTPPPPTAVPPQPTAAPPGTIVDSGPRQYANGMFASPYYTIAAGDTLYSIGLRFGLSTQQLIVANPAAANGIIAGQTLVIPGAGVPVQPIEPPPATAYERVTFDAGSIVATRNGVINNAQPAGYVLRALGGQVMEVSTTSNGEPLTISVQAAGGGALPVNGENGQLQNNTWVSIPADGDYYVTITPVITPENMSLGFAITFVIQ